MLLHFHVLLTSLGLGVLLSFFLRPLLFHFPDPWMRAFARTLSHSCSRAHSPSRSRARLFLHARVGVLVAWYHSGAHVPFPPPLSLWPGSLHSWCGCWPLGGGWVPSPSGVWGAAPGAFVLVCVVRVGWVVPSVSCALSGSPWFGKWLIVVAWRPSGLRHLLKAPVSSGAWVGSHRYHL